MPLHKNLSGAELHYPLGRSSEGTLLLEDDLASAYQIAQGSDNQFNVSTVNGTEEITIGNGVQNPKLIQAGTGNVGLGTTDPQEKVDVSVTGVNGGIRVINDTDNAYLKLDAPTDEAAYIDFSTGESNDWQIGRRPGSNDLTVYDNDGASDYVFTWEAGGNVGIGTTNPSTKLHVDGAVTVNGKISGVATPVASTDAANKAYVDAVAPSAWDGTSGSSPALGGNLDGNGNNIVLDNDTGIIDENGQEQMTFLTTSSAVNQLAVTNAAAGGNATAATSTAPIITGGGTTTNCDLALQGQGTGTVTVRSRGTNSGTLSLNNEGNTYAVNITVPLQDYLTADYTLTLPVDDGGSGQVMQSDGSGNLSWATPSSGGGYTVQAKDANFSAAVDYYYVIDTVTNTAAITVTLPNAGATASGKTMGFKARHGASYSVTLNRGAGGNIDGAASNLILSTDMAAVELICDGTDWWIKS